MMKKLKCCRGESLTESLVSILIVSISAAMLATMITASVSINRSANKASEELRMKMSSTESRVSVPIQSGTISIRDTFAFQKDADVLITSGEDTLRAYWRAP